MNSKPFSLLFFITLMNATVMPLLAMEQDPNRPSRKRPLFLNETDGPLLKKRHINKTDNNAMGFEALPMEMPVLQNFNPSFYNYSPFQGGGNFYAQSYIVAPILHNSYGQPYIFIPMNNFGNNTPQPIMSTHQKNLFSNAPNNPPFMDAVSHSTDLPQTTTSIQQEKKALSPYKSVVTFLMCWPTINSMLNQQLTDDVKGALISSFMNLSPHLKIKKICSSALTTDASFAKIVKLAPFVNEVCLALNEKLTLQSVKMAMTMYPHLSSLKITSRYMQPLSNPDAKEMKASEFLALVKKMPHLTSLHLQNFPHDLSAECLGNIIQVLPKLTSLGIVSNPVYGTPLIKALNNRPTLTSLDISHCDKIKDKFFSQIVEKLPSLTSLEIERLDFGISKNEALTIITKRPNISLGGGILTGKPSDADYWSLSSKLKNASLIDLSYYNEVTPNQIQELGKNNPKATSLRWNKIYDMMDYHFSVIVNSFPQLSAFDMKWLGKITKESLISGFKKLPNLRDLEFYAKPCNITSYEETINVLKACPNLRSLDMVDFKKDFSPTFFLWTGHILPHLSSLEVMLQEDTSLQDLENILISNPSLTSFAPRNIDKSILIMLQEKYPHVNIMSY